MDIFSPDSKNSDILIQKILTPLFGYLSEEKALFFSSAMEIFLQGCLTLVAILFIYNVVTGLNNTANTGKVLGGKSGLSWSILRNVAGLGLLIPLKSGIATAQLIFIWLVGQGLLLADTIYEKMDWFSLQNSNLAFVSNMQGDLLKSYRSAVIANACLLSGQSNAGVKPNGDRYKFSSSENAFTTSKGKVLTYKFGDFSTNIDKDNTLCGKISISFPVAQKGKNIDTGTAIDELTNFSLVDSAEISKALQAVHMAAMKDLLLNKAKETAKLIINSTLTEELNGKVADKIASDLAEYESKIRAEFSKISTVKEDVKEYMTKYGIASAGSWIWSLSNSQATLTNIVNDVPQVKTTFNTSSNTDNACAGFSYFSLDCKKSEDLKTASSQILTDIEKNRRVLQGAEDLISSKATTADSSLVKAALEQEKTEDNKSKFLSMFDGLSIKGMTVDRTTGTNSLVAMQSFGQNILLVVEGVIGVLLTASFFSSVGVSAAIATMPLLLAIAVPAIMMVFYFPFLPFILWFGNLIGWIVMICQGLLGIPLWLVSFIRNDADGFVGKTGQGYLLILEAFLRPSLMIFALFFAYNLLNPVVDLLNFFFLFVGNSIYSNTNGFLVIIYYVFMICIYAVLVNKIMKLLFGLIETIPDKLLIWIGSNINSIMSNAGKELDNMTEKAVGQHLSYATSTVGLVTNGITTGLNNLTKTPEPERQPQQQQQQSQVNNSGNFSSINQNSDRFKEEMRQQQKMWEQAEENLKVKEDKQHFYNSNVSTSREKEEPEKRKMTEREKGEYLRRKKQQRELK